MTYLRKTAVAAVLCCSMLLSFSWAACQQTSLASRLVRLHVVANSDTQADQRLKLQVRDAVLERCGALLEGETDLSQAKHRLSESLTELAAAGEAVVQQRGFSYPVSVRMEYASFPQTEYEGFALPAGAYQALRVEIGAAEGHNWWCVLFPSLCLTPASELSETAMAEGLTEQDIALMTRDGAEYEIRFRCVELWEELRETVTGKRQ